MNTRNMSKEQKAEVKALDKELRKLLNKHGYEIFSYATNHIVTLERGKRKLNRQILEKRKELRELQGKQR